MTANVGTITPSNNLNQWSRNYNPALFLGNISIAQFLNVQLAPATDGLVYNAGTILTRYKQLMIDYRWYMVVLIYFYNIYIPR